MTIDIFSTILKHPDHSRIVIPNRKIIGEILHNFGTIRQLHLTVVVSYQADIEKVLALIADILRQNTRILKEPAPSVGVSSLGESTIAIAVEPWTSVADYGVAQAEVNQAILGQFHAHHIERFIQEVRIINAPNIALQA